MRNNNFSIAFLFMLIQFSSSEILNGQILQFRTVCKLPPELKESSGLISNNHGATFWSHNDSDGKKIIYEIDSTCKLLRQVFIKNANSIDWEDITQDPSGNMYIGDFGNNNINRKDLTIYKIHNLSLIVEDTIIAESIHFTYLNQFDFPPVNDQKNFDMEAMIWYRDSLHLFSKNRTSPFSGYTYHHVLPDKPGQYQTILRDSVVTGLGSMFQNWVTGAALSTNDDKLMLLSYDRGWLFYPFDPEHMIQNPRLVTFSNFSQTEGLCFTSNYDLWITDELQSGIGGKLYHADLRQIIATNNLNFNSLQIYPNPSSDYIYINENDIQIVKFYNSEGIELTLPINSLDNQIDITNLGNGFYIIKLQKNNIWYSFKLIKT